MTASELAYACDNSKEQTTCYILLLCFNLEWDINTHLALKIAVH